MAVLMPLFAAIADQIKTPAGIPWEWLILHVFNFVVNYGWRIVLFTVLLKLVLMPLDIYQRVKMRKNQKITEKIKPEIEKLQKVYGGDKQTFSQKQMELNKREGYSYFSACLPMILTLVIFIWLWQSLTAVSQFMNMKQYVEWYDVYKATEQNVFVNNDYGFNYNEIYLDPSLDKDDAGLRLSVEEEFGVTADKPADAETQAKIDAEVELRKQKRDTIKAAQIAAAASYKASHPDLAGKTDAEVTEIILQGILSAADEAGAQAVFDFYHDPDLGNRESFLWIQNIWAADVPWTKPINDYTTFINNAGEYGKSHSRLGIAKEDFNALKGSAMYNKVTKKLRTDKTNNVNGYLILPLLAVGLSFLSYFITSSQQKKAGQINEMGKMAGSMKVMMFIMPLMMGFFALMYTSMFTIYMVINSATTILINLGTTLILNLVDKNKVQRAGAGVIRYGRPDPNSGKSKAKATKNSEQPVKYGRPDPNADLKNDDKKDKKK